MIPLLLMLAQAPPPDSMDDGATALARLSNEEAHLAKCELQAGDEEQKNGWSAVVGVWKRCQDSAQEQGLDSILSVIEGRILLAELNRDHGGLKRSDPLTYARILLISAANKPEALVPIEALQESWLLLVADTESRQNLADVRTVALRWTPDEAVAPDLRAQIEAHARRYIGDMGFKLAPGGSAEEGRADILILASASTQSLEPRVAEGEGYQGVLYVEQISISTGPVKFKARDSRARPMEISASAMHANRDSARAEAAEAAGQALAHALLERVIRELFAGRPLPVTP
ncbi:MAG: hypothetical protein H6741_10995 [Alphaproteobacteria bacterium]|nr:hypothetical protein [Alphaproteobacteria bacterium]